MTGEDGGTREDDPSMEIDPVPDGYPFALCLTHDVDRPYKTYQWLAEAAAERDPSKLRAFVRGENPYWRFDDLMSLERDLGVRSSVYLLNARRVQDRPPREWLRPRSWLEHAGGYDVTAPDVGEAVRRLDAGGWEVGLHGSYDSYDDPERLRYEKETLESVLGHEVLGGRQHYLNMATPRTRTWRHHVDVGLRYDASLGSSTAYGFRHGYGVHRPFGDGFAVFPLTLMEVALDRHPTVEARWAACERLLAEAADNGAVMTVLWHLRYLAPAEFPGYRDLYERLVERAREMGAWVGPVGDLYERLDHPTGPSPSHEGGRPTHAAADGGPQRRRGDDGGDGPAVGVGNGRGTDG